MMLVVKMAVSGLGRLLVLVSVANLVVFGPSVTDVFAATDFASALIGFIALIHLTLCAWVLLSAALVGSSKHSRCAHRWAQRLTPGLLRALLATGAAGALIATPLAANADPSTPYAASMPHKPHDSNDTPLAGLRLPDRPIGRPPAPRTKTPAPTLTVTVRSGDTLWAIAGASLDPGASNAQTAAAAARWYAANRDTIGADPDLINPNMVLRAPRTEDPS